MRASLAEKAYLDSAQSYVIPKCEAPPQTQHLGLSIAIVGKTLDDARDQVCLRQCDNRDYRLPPTPTYLPSGVDLHAHNFHNSINATGSNWNRTTKLTPALEHTNRIIIAHSGPSRNCVQRHDSKEQQQRINLCPKTHVLGVLGQCACGGMESNNA
jgi:hypothetical protein